VSPNFQNFLTAAGLVVVGLFALIAVWKITKSLVKLFVWFVALALLLAAAWWLLQNQGYLPAGPVTPP